MRLISKVLFVCLILLQLNAVEEEKVNINFKDLKNYGFSKITSKNNR